MNEKNVLNLEGGIGLAMWGKYKVQVFNPVQKEITYDSGWQKNLILNSGMDAIARVTYLSSCNLVGVIGTGSRPNIITSSTSQITQSGAQLYLVNNTGLYAFSSSFFSYSASAQIGDIIIDSDQSRSVVRSVIDDYNVIVDNSASYSTGKTFSIYKTSQKWLHHEISRSTTYLQGSSSAGGFNCGTVVSESQVTLRRTYDFPLVTDPAGNTFTEGGTSWNSTARSPTLFSRYVFPYPVFTPSGSQLRMVHDFVTRYSPITPRYITASVTGWPVLPSNNVYATESIQRFSGSTISKNMYSTVHPDTGVGYGSALDPAAFSLPLGNTNNGCDTFVSEDTDVLSPFGFAITRDNNVGRQFATDDGYTTGSYTRTKTAILGIYDAVSIAIRSIGFGQYFHSTPSNPEPGYDTERQAFCVRYDQPQTKTNTQQLRITWRFTWDRVLDR